MERTNWSWSRLKIVKEMQGSVYKLNIEPSTLTSFEIESIPPRAALFWKSIRNQSDVLIICLPNLFVYLPACLVFPKSQEEDIYIIGPKTWKASPNFSKCCHAGSSEQLANAATADAFFSSLTRFETMAHRPQPLLIANRLQRRRWRCCEP